MPRIGITCNIRDGENTLSLAYSQAVARSGAIPLLLPVCAGKHLWQQMLANVDGLLLSGGGDPDAVHFGEEATPAQGQVQPERDQMELFMAQRALSCGLPLLGICRGAQVMAIAAGGTLHQDIVHIAGVQHDQRAPKNYLIHGVRIKEKSLLHRIVGGNTLRVNSMHHQSVKTPGKLQVSAKAFDGIIEAVEAVQHPFALGVQWHPEWMTKYLQGRALFHALKQAALAYGRRQ
ncbi:gamma-glutamyl-gamma-aminobutyrate hydrolase family protein [Dethiobacter alkaliphilus]|uniref:gamma-glutamyl-gamma-aminobutyrate hydrolase family protein n=1 Tax=Dethiobacter alkaliphilus TaxID=427926 RepID=UPI002225BAD9|nr:gamma-glutamyl-gamma-aminobutyrate hydrolase family protein [Dethiobacter alkaliphilus]MCW3490561.1 gamma-glutamyl-gamma-aminobutyrate hydrolase family protein [Dethiobacter alkaliphilus]